MVSVAVVKNGGDSVHPIGNVRGKATRGSSSVTDGMTTPSMGIMEGERWRR
jgi:hypothetical protein